MSAIIAPAASSRASIAILLEEARARTLLLIESLSTDELLTQHDPLMSPILWDLGHIAHFEELWLTRNLDGPIEFSEMPGLYNPLEHPRATRANLPLPPKEAMLDLLAAIRERVLERLDSADFDVPNPLLRDGYVYQMVLQHEYQHNETILQTLQLKRGEPYHPPVRLPVPEPSSHLAAADRAIAVHLPAGSYPIGTSDRSVAYDNERPVHEVELAAFAIDAFPVTNADYLAFMDDGGYAEERLWSKAGVEWLRASGADAPAYWTRHDGTWHVRVMDRTTPVDPRRPVCHVCYHEAEAYAAWGGRRLPTEAEWETAVSWDPQSRTAQLYPWGSDSPRRGLANVDQLAFDTAPIGAFDRNVSPLGVYGMIGDVWEWTSSDFGGYPGFTSFPYREYSEEFFGAGYKVLRGGSWATRPGAIRNTFRNWDFPVRRQIFSGFRCARDD